MLLKKKQSLHTRVAFAGHIYDVAGRNCLPGLEFDTSVIGNSEQLLLFTMFCCLWQVYCDSIVNNTVECYKKKKKSTSVSKGENCSTGNLGLICLLSLFVLFFFPSKTLQLNSKMSPSPCNRRTFWEKEGVEEIGSKVLKARHSLSIHCERRFGSINAMHSQVCAESSTRRRDVSL